MKIDLRRYIVIGIQTVLAVIPFCNLDEPLYNTVCWLLLFGIFIFVNDKCKYKKNMWDRIPAFLFAMFMILGRSFKYTDSWQMVWGNHYQKFVALLELIGWFIIFDKGISVLHIVVPKIYYYKFNIKSSLYRKTTKTVMEKHPFIMPFIIMYVCWLPYMIIKYPGAWNYDSLWQINMIFGYQPLTTHHPPVSTFVIGGIVWLFSKFKDPEFGVFVYIICQSLFLASVLSFCMLKMAEMKIRNIFRWFILIVFALLPVFPSYATNAYKDVLYCGFMIIYMAYLLLC